MYTIDPLCVGRWRDPEPRLLYLGDCSREIDVRSYFFLVRGEGLTILVDTGYDLATGREINPVLQQDPGEDPLSHLHRRRIDPAEVNAVILTHLHWDHCSPVLGAFSQAQIYVQRKEYLAVTDPPHPWFSRFTYPDTIGRMGTDWRNRTTFLEGESTVYGGIRCVPMGGHTPGLQAVYVETRAGTVALPGDIVILYRNLEEDVPVGFNCNLEECFLGMRRLREETRAVLPSHDPATPEVADRLGIRGDR